MGVSARRLVRVVLLCGALLALPVQARTVVTLATGFQNPCGVAVDDQGNVFAAASALSEVREILAVGGSIPPSPVIRTLGSGFRFPCGVDVDAAGNVFVADTGNNQVKEMLAVGGSIPAVPTINVLASGFGFNLPGLLTLDNHGNVFVGDNSNHALYEIPIAGGYSTVNTVGSGFSNPGGVDIDTHGNVFVADGISGGAIYEIEAVGGSIPPMPVIRTLATGFNFPSDVKVDAWGNVYVADTLNNAVKKILAVGGSIPASPTIITLGSGIGQPLAIDIDGRGNVFVCNNSGGSIKEILAPAPPGLTIAFGAPTMPQNATTSLTFTVTNPNPDADSALGGVAFTDALPAGLQVATPNGLTGSCGGGTITAGAGSTSINLSGATVAPGAQCSFSVNIAATAVGTLVNTTGAIDSIDGGAGGTATATLTVVPATPVSLQAFDVE